MECLYVCVYVGSDVVGCMARMNATLCFFFFFFFWSPHNVWYTQTPRRSFGECVCLFVCWVVCFFVSLFVCVFVCVCVCLFFAILSPSFHFCSSRLLHNLNKKKMWYNVLVQWVDFNLTFLENDICHDHKIKFLRSLVKLQLKYVFKKVLFQQILILGYFP